MSHRFGNPLEIPYDADVTVTDVYIGCRKMPYKWIEADVDKVVGDYVDGLNLDYHRFKHRSFLREINGKGRGHAVASIRQNQLELIEYISSILCAFAQAPQGLPLWMNQYRNGQLDETAEFILGEADAKEIVLSVGAFGKLTNISEKSYSGDAERQAFTIACKFILDEYLAKGPRAEYGALKHSDRGYVSSFDVKTNFALIKAREAIQYITAAERISDSKKVYVLEHNIHPIPVKEFLAEIELTFRIGDEILRVIRNHLEGRGKVVSSSLKIDEIKNIISWKGKKKGYTIDVPIFIYNGKELEDPRNPSQASYDNRLEVITD